MKVFDDMPSELCKKLHGLSINEAIDNGLIDKIGYNDSEFIFPAEDGSGKFYAIIQDFKIQCSEKLMEKSFEEIEDRLGDLSLFRYLSDGKECFRLGIPSDLKLGKAVVYLKYQEEDKNDLVNELSLLKLKPQSVSPKNPQKGFLYFDEVENKLRCYDGNSWQNCWG